VQERKDLVAGGYRDKHFWWGAVLLGGGVFFAIEGAFNTWFRTGKLFPGPHLFAGAGIVALWALAAALVPAMQKGDNNARNAHIALNAVNLALFAWQVRASVVNTFSRPGHGCKCARLWHETSRTVLIVPSCTCLHPRIRFDVNSKRTGL
jgi:hypothetical protein